MWYLSLLILCFLSLTLATSISFESLIANNVKNWISKSKHQQSACHDIIELINRYHNGEYNTNDNSVLLYESIVKFITHPKTVVDPQCVEQFIKNSHKLSAIAASTKTLEERHVVDSEISPLIAHLKYSSISPALYDDWERPYLPSTPSQLTPYDANLTRYSYFLSSRYDMLNIPPITLPVEDAVRIDTLNQHLSQHKSTQRWGGISSEIEGVEGVMDTIGYAEPLLKSGMLCMLWYILLVYVGLFISTYLFMHIIIGCTKCSMKHLRPASSSPSLVAKTVSVLVTEILDDLRRYRMHNRNSRHAVADALFQSVNSGAPIGTQIHIDDRLSETDKAALEKSRQRVRTVMLKALCLVNPLNEQPVIGTPLSINITLTISLEHFIFPHSLTPLSQASPSLNSTVSFRLLCNTCSAPLLTTTCSTRTDTYCWLYVTNSNTPCRGRSSMSTSPRCSSPYHTCPCSLIVGWKATSTRCSLRLLWTRGTSLLVCLLWLLYILT